MSLHPLSPSFALLCSSFFPIFPKFQMMMVGRGVKPGQGGSGGPLKVKQHVILYWIGKIQLDQVFGSLAIWLGGILIS